MNKEKIIKNSQEFTSIISTGKSVKNNYFKIFYIPTEKNLYGITVPKKVGKAHLRNKLKRRLKNIILTNEKDIQNNMSYVIIIKEASLELEYSAMENSFLNLIKKVRK